MKRFAPVVAIALAALLAPASASATVERASAADVSAELSYDKRGDFDYTNVHIKIERGGKVVADEPLPPPCDMCSPVPASEGHSLTVRDLDRTGTAEVIVDQFTGGAHCCFVSVIYFHDDATGREDHLIHDWRDASYRLKDLDGDGQPELLSADARFDYEFTAHVFSSFPIQIWHFSRGALVDLTRGHFRRVVARDARRQLALYRRIARGPKDQRDVRGAVAAYVADEYSLGTPKRGWRLVRSARRRHQLRGLGGPEDKRYVRRLRAFLKKLGYAA